MASKWMFGDIIPGFEDIEIRSQDGSINENATMNAQMFDKLIQRYMLAQNVNRGITNFVDRVLDSKENKRNRAIEILRIKKEFGLSDDEYDKLVNDNGEDSFANAALAANRAPMYTDDAKSVVKYLFGGKNYARNTGSNRGFIAKLFR